MARPKNPLEAAARALRDIVHETMTDEDAEPPNISDCQRAVHLAYEAMVYLRFLADPSREVSSLDDEIITAAFAGRRPSAKRIQAALEQHD